VSGRRWIEQHQYIQKRKKGKHMRLKELLEQFQHLSPMTQVALIALVLIVLVLVIVFPQAGNSIITFLLGLKMLVGR
jgi:hypothetical protein